MSTTKPQVKRTYGSQNSVRRLATTGSSLDVPSAGAVTTLKRKRPLVDLLLNQSPPKKKKAPPKTNSSIRNAKTAKKKETLTQLHFCIDQSTLRTCPLCDLTYTKGAIDDENLHKAHCARVRKGLEWGREEEKELGKDEGISMIIEDDVPVGEGEHGRIVAIKPSATGKLGSKLLSYVKTVNLALSAPDIPASALNSCKVYLFLLRTPKCTREKIVGCVIAQRISSAMEVASPEEVSSRKDKDEPESLVHVEGDLYCKPQDTPTTMGIPRLFVSSAHRRKGIARSLLDAAAKTFIYGSELDPAKGEVAFSQPTSMGRVFMERWGRGGVRVYKE